MTAFPVEWVLVIYYGPSAHRATYGRLDGRDTRYTKDYIQLSRRSDFISDLSEQFPLPTSGSGSSPITYRWPSGSASGQIVFHSSDRPHLSWETRAGAPLPWKMSLSANESSVETIPGDPTHLDAADAERELTLLTSRDGGQPYLMAIKLRDDPGNLHLRVYLNNPGPSFEWANINQLPDEIRELADQTSQRSALAYATFRSGSSASGLLFDPSKKNDAWLKSASLTREATASLDDDVVAEREEASDEEVDRFRQQIQEDDFEVPDSHSTVKTRGSAQRAFAESVKNNYGFQCAVTGIKSREFLVAAHIVPWSADKTIRLDPANGICLSLLVDRAFENGLLQIDDDLTIRVIPEKVGRDEVLQQQLVPYDGKKLREPESAPPNPDYLRRRRELVSFSEEE